MASVGTCRPPRGRLHGAQPDGWVTAGAHPTRGRQPVIAAVHRGRVGQVEGTNSWVGRRTKLSGKTWVSRSPESNRARNPVTGYRWTSCRVERPAKTTTGQLAGSPPVSQYSSLPLSLRPSGSKPPGSGQGGSGSRSGNFALVSA